MSLAPDSHHAVEPPLDEPWRIEPEPTNLLATWPNGAGPRDAAPERAAILDALRAHFGDAVNVLDAAPPAPPGVEWCAAVELPGQSGPAMLWCEPARSAPPGEAGPSKWVLGVETMLRDDDPVADFHGLMRFFAVGLSDVPAVLDVNTTTWHTRRELDDFFASDDLAPPEDVLWVVQAVRQSRASGRLAWLHTHGLWRCGRPELEIIEVPGDRAEDAAALLNAVASLLLEQPPPPPGVPLAVGVDLAVVLQHWSAVAPYVAAGVPGGMDDRAGDDGAHAGARAVVCAAAPVGTFRELWVWPRDVTERLSRGDVCLYRTKRATSRQAKLARREWPHFARACALVCRPSPVVGWGPSLRFFIEAVSPAAVDRPNREHLWYEVKSIETGRVEVRIASEPRSEGRLRHGDAAWIDLEEVSDWRMTTNHGSFGPDRVPAMLEALRNERRGLEA